MPGKKYRSIKRPKQYEGLKRRGFSKSRAAALSNAQAKKAKRKAAARKGGRKRKRGGRKKK
jgi:hypothetical protein